MLEFLRRGVKSWVAKGLLLLLIASFAVWGISDVFSMRIDSAVATVGEETVTYEEYANALQRQRRVLIRRTGRPVSYQEMRAQGIDRGILAGLMRDRAFRLELARLGLAAPDEAVAEEIRAIGAFQSGGEFSPTAYRMELGRLGYTPAQFEELTRTLIGQDMLAAAAEGAVAAPPGMAARIAAWQGEQRAARSVLLPIEAAPDPGEPDEAALETHYVENGAAYEEPERRTGLVLALDIETLKNQLAPSEEEIAAAYERDREAYATPASAVIDQLPLGPGDPEETAAPVLSGEIPLEALAVRLGEDPEALSIGRVERGDLPEAVAEAVFAAEGPGIVGPVEAPIGPVLVRVREIEQGGIPPLEEIRGRIAERIATDRALDRMPEIANAIDDARAAGQPLAEIAEAQGLTLRRFEGLAADGTFADGSEAGGMLGREAVLDEVFEALDLEEREILSLGDGSIALVMVERIEPAEVPPLEEIRDRVAEDWRAAARLEALVAEAGALADEVAPGRGLAALAAERELEIATHPAFPRQVLPERITRALGAEVFRTPAGRAVAGAAPDGAGAVVVEVTRILPPDPEMMETLVPRLEGSIEDGIAADDREFFARAVEDAYPRTVDQAIYESVHDRLSESGL